jgi:arsenate reductase
MKEKKITLLPEIAAYVSTLPQPPASRQQKLIEVSDYISQRRQAGEEARIVFICTHNSRRSQLAQVWMAVLSDYYGVAGLRAYSGGTEATAFHPNALSALERVGFAIAATGEERLVSSIAYAGEADPLTCFSKVYEHPENPQRDFAAVMVCSEAGEACPFVPGADRRFLLTFADPRHADGAPNAQEAYDDACRTIASELNFILKNIANYDGHE